METQTEPHSGYVPNGRLTVQACGRSASRNGADATATTREKRYCWGTRKAVKEKNGSQQRSQLANAEEWARKGTRLQARLTTAKKNRGKRRYHDKHPADQDS